MRSKYLPLYLPGDLYQRLEQAAIAEERDPLQHVRYLLKRSLGTDTTTADAPDSASEVAHAATS